MENSEFKRKKKTNPEVVAIRNLCNVLKRVLTSAINSVKKQFQARYKLYLNYIENYLTLLNRTEDKLTLIHYKWFLKLYDDVYEDIGSIIDEDVHGIQNNDFLLDPTIQVYVGDGTEMAKKNYRLPIGNIYKFATANARRYMDDQKEDSEIDPKLQLECLTPWEIKYYLLEIFLFAVKDEDPNSKDIESLEETLAKLKYIANLTDEQAREQAKKSVSGLAKGIGGFMKVMGLKDDNGNPLDATGANTPVLVSVLNDLMTGSDTDDLAETFGNSKGKTPEEMVSGAFGKIKPIISKAMLAIPRPPGLKDKEGDSIMERLASAEGGQKIQDGLLLIMEGVGIGGTGSAEKKSRSDSSGSNEKESSSSEEESA